MRRPPLRTITAALTGALVVGLVCAPASATPGAAAAPRHGQPVMGPAPMDGGGEVTAPVSEDARPVEPEVELVELDGGAAEVQTSTAPVGDPDTEVDRSDLEPGAEVSDEPDGGRSATFWASTPDLAVIGLTWDAGTAPDDLGLRWRTQLVDGWSAWDDVPVHGHSATADEHAEHGDVQVPADGEGEAQERDGTEPLVAIGAVAVEVTMTSATDALPSNVTFAVVDPGESEADDALDADGASVAAGSAGTQTGVGVGSRLVPERGPVPMAPTGTARPTIYSRAQWGADESIMTWTPSQGRVQGTDIHHTVNTNDYTTSQVPGIIRGIYAYHAQDWGRGWGDIGYNFLVDKFGRIWEGRYGGVDQAPVGAHATGLNSNFTGISFIGNADTAPVPAAAFTSIAKIAAWKLALHGVTSPHGRVTVDAGTFNRVNGHRDSKQTTCPGRYLYDRLPELRNRIASYIGTFTPRHLPRDLDGDGYADLAVAHDGQVSLVSTVNQGRWYAAEIDKKWGRTVDAGDFDGDGLHDLISIRGNGEMWLFPGNAQGRVDRSAATFIMSGWQHSNIVVGGVDINGDRRPDIVARQNGTGNAVVYFNDGRGKLRPRVPGGSGFERFDRLTLADKFVNGRPALIAHNSSTGEVRAYPFETSGALGPEITVYAASWKGMRLVTGVGDLDGDGRGDVVTIDAKNRLWFYPGTGTGKLHAGGKIQLDTGVTGLNELIGAGISGGMWSFYSVASSGGTLKIIRYKPLAWAYETLKPTGLTIADGDRVVVAGDWTWDGVPDLFVIRSGRLMLHAGRGGGTFEPNGVRIGTGDWRRFAQVVGAGNWRGDGLPGLIAYDAASGRLWYYPSDGQQHFQDRVLISNGADGMDMLVNAGRLAPPGVPDLLMRGADSKRMFYYQGNGPGLALPPKPITIAWSTVVGIVGTNDVSGDGVGDIVAVTTSGALRLYKGRGDRTLVSPVVVGQLPAGSVIS